ncbi:MAG: pyrophosphohydrolase containing a Zn-finger, nucleic-acid-binding, partial [Firmicutes bacterium]|nr:pyrophosphohydrolase containing a Zn-finger, nucleic-acid-binding [Bacillota bacterium]
HRNKVLAAVAGTEIHIPFYHEIEKGGIERLNFIYLFSIDETKFFLADMQNELKLAPFGYEKISILRFARPKDLVFAGLTAYQLYNFYQTNRYCGRCGSLMERDHKERMLSCSSCHNKVYPKIAPAVIVGVTNGDRILLTKYTDREYKRYALIAGFMEIGETAEETVKREVMEETGVKVKNITYYKSQPWAIDNNILLGFFAELDGDDSITLDKAELEAAEWLSRSEITEVDDGFSLTREMIIKFKNGG